MNANNLSSNWKQLQAKLQSSTTTTAPSSPPAAKPATKRKRPNSTTNTAQPAPRKKARPNNNAPALQPTPRPPHRPIKMTSSSSTPALTPSTAPPTQSAPTILPNTGLSASITPGKYLSLDCEMVGTGPPPHTTSILARCSLVTYHGQQLYDTYVLPTAPVTDYRTPVSGIRPHHLTPSSARPFSEVQKTVAGLLKGRVLVGHSVRNDLAVLGLGHPRGDVRDTARYTKFRAMVGGGSPRLRDLAEWVLGVEVQVGEHSSVEDARVAMMLFRGEKEGMEREVRARFGAGVGGNGRGRGMEVERGRERVLETVARERMGEAADGKAVEGEEEGGDGGHAQNGDVNGEGTAKKKRKKKKKKKK